VSDAGNHERERDLSRQLAELMRREAELREQLAACMLDMREVAHALADVNPDLEGIAGVEAFATGAAQEALDGARHHR
jgi:hypothetical protein